MKPTPWLGAEPYRLPRHPMGPSSYGDDFGAFCIPAPVSGRGLTVIASTGLGWDHVSVSTPNRCPNWPEMSFIKDIFFSEDETVMQLHVPKSDHVNFHPYCLHMWRPQHAEIPRPPTYMVGPRVKP